jgi:hypothetical protein
MDGKFNLVKVPRQIQRRGRRAASSLW